MFKNFPNFCFYQIYYFITLFKVILILFIKLIFKNSINNKCKQYYFYNIEEIIFKISAKHSINKTIDLQKVTKFCNQNYLFAKFPKCLKKQKICLENKQIIQKTHIKRNLIYIKSNISFNKFTRKCITM